jgi:hypothetical protein
MNIIKSPTSSLNNNTKNNFYFPINPKTQNTKHKKSFKKEKQFSIPLNNISATFDFNVH